ncbi:MAG: hypothetical protein PUG88_05315, partial [Eubacterium coprostanoligenes]
MNKAVKVRYYIESLCIYDFKQDEIINALYDLLNSLEDETVLTKQSRFFNLLSSHHSLRHYVSKLILTDDNVFTKAAAAGKCDELDPSILDGVKADLEKLEVIASISAEDIYKAEEDSDIADVLKTMPKWNPNGRAMLPLTDNWAEHIEDLKSFHRTNGYGMFAKFVAFTWRNEEFVPITAIDSIRLTDLKNYEVQRGKVV